ncbi:MAG: glucosamine-6-phosphate deaminase, partial [Acetanaerobacterium sp.]
MKIINASDYNDMSRKAANIISAQVILFPRSVLGLATGSTPLGTYRQLTEWYRKGDIDFSEVHSVNLDEYFGLSPDNPQSYHYYMQNHFFSQVNTRRDNTFIPNGTAMDAQAECARYDGLISSLGGIDLQLLGLGHTGHIGFNEPDASFGKMTHVVRLKPETIEANARFFTNIDEVPKAAITMGIRSIMQAKKILLLISGSNKADILEKGL